MRILHCTAQTPAHTGSGIFLSNVIRVRKRDEVHHGVFFATAPSLPRSYGFSHEFLLDYEKEGLGETLYGMSDRMPYPSRLYSSLQGEKLQRWIKAACRSLAKAVEEFRPDVILSHHLFLLTALAVETGIPVVGVCHGTDLVQLTKNPEIQTGVMPALEKLRLVVTLSQGQKEEVENLWPKLPVMALQGGYREDLFYYEKKVRRPLRVVYVGKLSEEKGLGRFISLMERWDRKKEIYIVGKGPLEDRFRAQTKDLSHFHWMGALPQKELAALLRRAHLFVLPSEREGFSLATVEALAAGLSAVVPAWPNLVGALKDTPLVGKKLFLTPLPEEKNFYPRTLELLERAVQKRGWEQVPRGLSQFSLKENGDILYQRLLSIIE